MLKEVEGVADKILKECVREGLSDKEVFENIYNHICKNYHYQTERDNEGNYPSYSYNIAVLLKNGGVCKGYALILVYLLGKVQVPVSYIVGNAGTSAFNGESLHAWNLLETTTGVYHIDQTWDLNNTHTKKFLYHDDRSIQSRKHFWSKMEYPACNA